MQVYRFRDKVAINPPTGETFYLDMKDAKALSEAIFNVAWEIACEIPFSKSTVGTVRIETTGSP